MEEKQTIYEVGFHIVPTVSTEELNETFNQVKELLTSHKGSIISEDSPKNRNLAYTLTRIIGGVHKRFNNAFFGWVKFEMPSQSVAEVKEVLDKNERIIRFIIIKTVRENTLTSLIRAPKDEKNKEKSADITVKPEINEEEIDKTIDEMIAN